MTAYDPHDTRYDLTRAIPQAPLSDIVDTILDLSSSGRVPARLLDVGCGTGRFLEPLSRFGAEIVGVDLSLAMLKARLGQSNVPLVQAIAQALPFAPSTFDGVLAVSLLHLLAEELGPSLHEVRRVLKPGGIFVYGSTHHRGPDADAFEELRFEMPRRLIADSGSHDPSNTFHDLPARIGAILCPTREVDAANWPVEVRVGDLVDSLARGEWSESFRWETTDRARWVDMTKNWMQRHGRSRTSVLHVEKVFRLYVFEAPG